VTSPRKIDKTQILAFSVLIAVFVLLFPMPMSRSREELYMTTETYYDEAPQVVNETISIPCQVVKNMQWQVTWYTLTGDKQWGASVGSQTFDSTFVYDWGTGVVYGGYDDYIGFIATGSFYLEAAGLHAFTLGSDTASKLEIDGTTVIDLWFDHVYLENTRRGWWLSQGWHAIKISYYELQNLAKVYFDVDKGDLFSWEETQYFPVQVPRIQIQQIPKQRTTVATRTVTETVYMSILEYLMKGGRT